MKQFKQEENKTYDAEELKNYFINFSESVKFINSYNKEININFMLLDQTKEIIIKNYPYGFKRTNIKYKIESNKRGCRFISQTLNPKTNLWNKPKASTYDPIMLLISKENGHISYLSLDHNSDKEKIIYFKDNLKDYLNEIQKKHLSEILAFNKVMENVTFNFINVNEIENLEEHNKEQDKIKKYIDYSISKESQKISEDL